ncbi:MAG: ribonuclease III [Candidatus Competibacteraceae bacterium]|uniref:Ribonuclease 3 n=1 Tax=Candidatus Contendobacter odensis Run_B_J11 TaxID=1400861 RepID=A0A7U7J3I5_9GAMM|nr:ribonuclease III [Candidatus Contendobacter odensis]MBK8534783.1 ribonuclease III [Candidatus Competibacteraceae bacterium]MBK8753566.1 ribonuclease III [Candidatus Competibacteraceae bacterium]CDH45243.1 RNase III, ds RNA [Candidatus Contendobacter odensis Run_B_J11]
MNLLATQLCTALDYTFQQPELLEEALTHRSASVYNNERLEFLGDALLSLVIAEYLFQRYPKASEGELSRLRASLVKGEALAELARSLNLGKVLRLGQGELKSGGSQRESILSDALEAIFGAAYLDGGLTAGRTVILHLYRERLEELASASELKDPKTRLQEYQQARQQPLPMYNVLEIHGEPHAQSFRVECAVAEFRAVAVGNSRRKAEQEAARLVLEQMQ